MKDREVFVHANAIQAFLIAADPFVAFFQIIVALLQVVVSLEQALLIVAVRGGHDGQQQVHDDQKPDERVNDEEHRVCSLRLVSWQHDVWEVRRRDQDEHLVGRLRVRTHVLRSLQRAAVDGVAKP